MRCPNGKAFILQYRQHVKGNAYGRQEEIYRCEDCSGCPYAEKCKKAEGNRTVRINQELTAIHREVIQNLESIHGSLLRMNRSIQAEGTFGVIKHDRWYKRIVRIIPCFGRFLAGTRLRTGYGRRRGDIAGEEKARFYQITRYICESGRHTLFECNTKIILTYRYRSVIITLEV